MGNQHSNHNGDPPQSTNDLDSFRKERQRDEHLKNLGFKRSKSLRKSISKKLKKHRAKKEVPKEEVDSVPPLRPLDSPVSVPKNVDPPPPPKKEEVVVEKRELPINPVKRKVPQIGEIQPLPTQVQVRAKFLYFRFRKIFYYTLSIYKIHADLKIVFIGK